MAPYAETLVFPSSVEDADHSFLVLQWGTELYFGKITQFDPKATLKILLLITSFQLLAHNSIQKSKKRILILFSNGGCTLLPSQYIYKNNNFVITS